MTARDAASVSIADKVLPGSSTALEAMQRLLAWIEPSFAGLALTAAGHRIVHGGLRYRQPTIVDADVIVALRDLVPLAPLLQPQAIAAIEALARMHPALLQIACFDTAFHHTMPTVASTFAIPYAVTAAGLR